MLHKLTEDFLGNHVLNFICSDYNNLDGKFDKYIYLPESFTISDKIEKKPLIFFDDMPYDVWVCEMIQSILNEIDFQDTYDAVCSCVQDNLKTLLDFEYRGKKLKEQIYNQEFIDVVRRVVAFTLYNDVDYEIDTAKKFNTMADKIMPIVIKKIEIEDSTYSDETLLKLSIISGISGLDLKGAPAASSKYSNLGIPMKPFVSMQPQLAAEKYLDQLQTILEGGTYPIFNYNEFNQYLCSARKITWFTDDYIETYFDLVVIKRILQQYNIIVEIVPKNGIYGNDTSWRGLEKMLKLPVFNTLNEEILKGRLIINKNGPKMGALNLTKLSSKVISAIESADFCVMKGCRIFEMTQGFMKKTTFYSYIVARYLSEITSGFDSSKYPLVFMMLHPYEYGYFGVTKQNSKEKIFDNKRRVVNSMNTISDHINNIYTKEPIKLINEFNYLKSQLDDYKGNKRPVYQEMNSIAERFVAMTKQTYDRMCNSYRELRHDEPHDLDKKMWDFLSGYIERNISEKPIRLLDVATGSGRDIMYASKLGYLVTGIDNSDGFIHILSELESQKKIPKGCYKKCDMRMLDFPDNSFNVVRQNASLLHLPLVGHGYMVDKAISESYRVLKDKGLMYIFVKKGSTLEFVDTNEGLGGRIFQFYTEETIKEVVTRNKFTVLSITEEVEKRKNGEVKWIAVIAQK